MVNQKPVENLNLHRKQDLVLTLRSLKMAEKPNFIKLAIISSQKLDKFRIHVKV